MMQTTLEAPLQFHGQGLHGGVFSTVRIRPLETRQGIFFRRMDLAPLQACIRADWRHALPASLCTLVGNPNGPSVSTIEHLMFALSACGISNAMIDVEGPEIPILDGSALPFVEAIRRAGVRDLPRRLEIIEVVETTEVHKGDAFVRISPSDRALITFEIDFEDPAIGRGRKTVSMEGSQAADELSWSRTFCFQSDIAAMKSQGYALGGNLGNAVVFDRGCVLNPEGLRSADEPLRHKLLDAIGDLALAGRPLLGSYTGHKAGHDLTRRALVQMMMQPHRFRIRHATEADHPSLPRLNAVFQNPPGCLAKINGRP